MGLQEDMAGLSQSDLECMKILLPGLYAKTLKQPTAMAWAVGGHRKVVFCLDDEQSLAQWKVEINVKVFDLTTYQKQYAHDFEAGGSQLSLPIVEPRSFAVIMKKYHLKAKYLAKNVLVDFKVAHSYQQRQAIELQMARQSWFVALERTRTNNKVRMSLKFRWDEFCASNHINIGDTRFFSVIHEATYSDDEDEEWEVEQEYDEAKLKVEVRKMNGGWLR
ncbi:B3 domain-containing protein Os03g0212300-like [Miscanthus floridulus]|uniref:B3 domain-containing protein Os03g0212300-like n=1 Tax=Miscanthus floridulus TaxID=154761 RepID=UPI00345AF368